MRESLLRFGFDPLLVCAWFALSMAMAGLLLMALRRMRAPASQLANQHARKHAGHRNAGHRNAGLEGLRGVLALAVAAHHACCWYYFTQFGVWTTGRSMLFERLANFGVMQFFYLSGFLFWRKLMRAGTLPLGRFYLSRLVRIGPVYYVCIGAAMVTGIAVLGFRLLVTPGQLAASLAPWLLFSQGAPTPVDQADIFRITAGVTWTLSLEWLFYLSLPFLAWFARRNWRLAVYALLFGLAFLAGRQMRATGDFGSLHTAGAVLAVYAKFMLIGFGGGVLVAAMQSRLEQWRGPVLQWRPWLLAACYAAYLLVPGIGNAGQILLLAGFALVVTGTDLFGLLTSRPMRLLGALSYPIYLLHGMIYFWAERLRGGMHTVSLPAYLAQTIGCLAAILLIATVVHLFIERPTIETSESIARGGS